MSPRPKILHLIDDTTAGGVMRVVDYILGAPELAEHADHTSLQVTRGKISAKRFDADIIVSHMAINWRNLQGLFALRSANAGKTIIHVEHSYTEGFVSHNVTRRLRFAALLRIGFSLFDRVVAVSQAQADWFVARNLCRASKVMTIRSCVDLSPFRAIPSTIGPLRTFAAIGRLDRQKGFDRLIEAFKSIPNPDFALHIYGQGDQEAALRDLAEGDSRIVFKGFAATPTAAYENIDAVIMPSRWEAYGLVAIEALSAGRALLCADTDGMRDHAKLGARMLKDPSLSGLRAELDRIAALGHEMPASPCRFSDRLERDFAAGWRNVAALAKVQPELGLQPVAGGRA